MDGSDAEVGDRGHRPGVGGRSVLYVYIVYSVFLAFLAGSQHCSAGRCN